MAANNGSSVSNPTKPQNHSNQYGDPAYKKLSRINGDINRMTKDQMKEKLANLHLDTRGQKDVLKKRLKNYFKRKHIIHPGIAGPKQPHYSYYIVIDFEATCDENSHNYPHEIIEFPAVLVNAADGLVVDEFHAFVRPTANSHLTEFCKTLTDITQEQVDAAATFPDVLRDMERWMKSHQLGKGNRYAIVTDGPWDMSRFLFLQCLSSDIAYPNWAKRWVNIRKVFCNAYGVRAGVSTMLEVLGLAFEGRPHSGIDDARNIARILMQLISDGCNIYENEKLAVGSPTASSDTQAAEVLVLEQADADSMTNDADDDDDAKNTPRNAHAVADSSAEQTTKCANSAEELASQTVPTKQMSSDTANCAALLEQLSA